MLLFCLLIDSTSKHDDHSKNKLIHLLAPQLQLYYCNKKSFPNRQRPTNRFKFFAATNKACCKNSEAKAKTTGMNAYMWILFVHFNQIMCRMLETVGESYMLCCKHYYCLDFIAELCSCCTLPIVHCQFHCPLCID